ncbi:hypothetical protein KXX06_006032, partial [Aspergillus fumigatus]
FHVNYMQEAGPFATVRDFHDWFTFLHRKPMPDPYSIPVEPFRHDLPDDCAIKFTHGDLHRSNIIVTPTRPYRILAVVDWEQSGWLPYFVVNSTTREEAAFFLPSLASFARLRRSSGDTLRRTAAEFASSFTTVPLSLTLAVVEALLFRVDGYEAVPEPTTSAQEAIPPAAL